MRPFLLALTLAGLLALPTVDAFAQTVPVPAPPTTGCIPKRDNFFPPVISTGATCSGMIYGSTVDPVMHQTGDVWLFDGYQDTCLEITMRSTQIDAYLEVGRWFATDYLPIAASDDDSAGWTDARVRAYIPNNGSYFIHATSSPASYGAASGSYTLSLMQVPC
jgi:hypothetical protein